MPATRRPVRRILRRTGLVRSLLRVSGLPSLEPVAVGPEAEEVLPKIARASRWATERRSGGAAAEGRLPAPADPNGGRSSYGSARSDIETLEPVRLSNDTTEFGNQQTVYASNDPVWAIYFAILRRDPPFERRNGSIGIVTRACTRAGTSSRSCRRSTSRPVGAVHGRALQFAIAPAGGEQARPRPWCVEASSPRASPPAAGVPSRATGRSGSRRGSASCRPRRSRASA